MTVFAVLLLAATAAAAPSASLREGLAALEANRDQEAVALLEAAPDLATSYEGLVGLAVARGRLGGLEAAEDPLAAAIRLDPGRAEARIERGGLRFLQHRYDEAIDDLSRALRGGEDAYARDLLASSLLLAGRPLEAIESWNRLGQPRLETLTISGLQHTRDAVVRRELRVHETRHVDAGALRAGLRTLDETGAFADVQVRGSVLEGRALSLEVQVDERHAFGEPIELASATITNALVGRARLKYYNVAGRGIGIGAFYRWEGERPRLEGAIDWPRPFGLPLQWRVSAYRERQPYAMGVGPLLVHRARGVDVRFRRVLDAVHAGDLTLRWRERRFDRFEPSAPPGRIVGLEGGFERALLDGARRRLEATLRGFVSARALGSEVPYESAVLALRYRWKSAAAGPPASQVAVRALWGLGRSTPLDQMFAPGAAPDAEYPLRGHRLRSNGALGGQPMGRELRLVNLEYRRELWSRPLFGIGFTAFHDVAEVRRAVNGSNGVLFDLGLGMRLRFGASPVIRVDYGKDLRGGGSAWTVVIGEPF